jgi:hypothetical protein
MARYRRPRALSQRKDPSEAHLTHENNNCTPTSAAAALDYHTGGTIKKRGGHLRHSLPNPNTGSSPGVGLSLVDARVAWGKFNQTLVLDDGWANIKARRLEGRMLILQGDSGDLDGSCSESQDVGHAIAIHPDTPPADKPGGWLVMDPWCYLAGSDGLGKWRWIKISAIYKYASKSSFRHAYTRRRSRIA